MDEKVANALSKVKEQLFNEPEVKEYFYLKSQIQNNEELLGLDKNIKDLQRKLCKNSKNKDLIDEYRSALNSYNSHPLVVNFNRVKEEVNDLLRMIKEILEE